MTDKPERWFLLIWLVVTLWILACAILVQGEYGDGYQTIVNARYLFGDSPNFYVQRGPLAAVLLLPVDLVVGLLSVDPVDVRPYHYYSGLWHSAYLLGCWGLLRRAPGGPTARLTAFSAAVLSVVFYEYAPYLSHDILPGLVFLLMIFLSHRWIERSNPADAVYLVLIGAGVALFKQTFAIFWVALLSYALLAALFGWNSRRMTPRKFFGLAALAATSAAISWLGYAWFIGGEVPDAPFFARPLRLMAAVAAQYGTDEVGAFPPDLYLRNLHNYGIAAMLLVLPGVLLALRGSDARMRQVAVCWLVAVVAMQSVGFREVRYLAFLAPLTAMLLVPVVQDLLTRRIAFVALLGMVIFDQSRGLSVAVQQVTSSARINVARFVNAPAGHGRMVISKTLSFVHDGASPLRRDRYHGIYHVTPLTLQGLYEGATDVNSVDDPRDLGLNNIVAGDRVYYSNDTMIRRPPWAVDNTPASLDSFLLVAGDAVQLELVVRDSGYERKENDGAYVMFVPAPEVGQKMPVITTGALSDSDASDLYGSSAHRAPFNVTAIVVQALCQADSCRYR